MTDNREPPRLGYEAPGLVWRGRASGWAATWQARSGLVKRGYLPKTVALWTGAEPSAADALHIATRCQHLQSEMLLWSRGEATTVFSAFDGTLRSLINGYQTDKDSSYHKNRYKVRLNRDRMLRRLVASYGNEKLTDIKARVLLAWHKEWTGDGKKLATGSALVGQLRTLFSFGATLLEDPECERLCGVMHKMRFEASKARTVNITAAQADDVRRLAHAHFGWHSIAVGQAFQFECTLRQKDVVGEWVPLSEPGVSDVLDRGQKWIRGIRWEEIDERLILRHVTSKKQKLTEVDLKLAPMVLEELQLQIGTDPLLVVDAVTKKVTVNRHLLPAAGPVVTNDNNALPWSDSEYRRKWRKVAKKAGVPAEVFNMDSRSGAISEAIQAGASLEMVRHAATHSDISQTADYDRDQAQATAKVMRLRMENRNKPKTGND
jgi:hypothetical protein